jgi:hypothetical protein
MRVGKSGGQVELEFIVPLNRFISKLQVVTSTLLNEVL